MLQKLPIQQRGSTTVLNMFYYYKISILEWFQKDQVTEDRSNDSENSALHHRNKLHFTIYYIVILFPNITVLLYFLSNKCSLAKYIRDFFQKHQILKPLNVSVNYYFFFFHKLFLTLRNIDLASYAALILRSHLSFSVVLLLQGHLNLVNTCWEAGWSDWPCGSSAWWRSSSTAWSSPPPSPHAPPLSPRPASWWLSWPPLTCWQGSTLQHWHSWTRSPGAHLPSTACGGKQAQGVRWWASSLCSPPSGPSYCWL